MPNLPLVDLRRLRAGEWTAALGGTLLLASLFLPWYGPDVTAWEAFAATDVLLALVAACGALLLVVTATQRAPALPLALDALVALAALAGLALVVIRALWLPAGAEGREWALWLGLAGALALEAGAWVAMRDERLSPPGRTTDAAGAPVPPPPELERIPAPPAGAGRT